MTNPTTPAQMREAAALAVANIEIGYHDGIGGDWHPYNGLHIISAACAAIRALPVSEPLCTWPSCNHTAKGQCRTYSSGQMLAPNDASSTATNTPRAEPERPADKIMTGLAEAKAFQDAILTGTGIMRGGKYVTPQEFFAEPEPAQVRFPASQIV
jgi:hypothetical protein